MRHALAGLALLLVTATAHADEPGISGSEIVSGEEPRFQVSGLIAGERIRIHAIRMFTNWEDDGTGTWRPVPKPLHAWADYLVDAAGSVELWAASPLAGTFSGADGYGLLWSGRPTSGPSPDPFLPEHFDVGELKDGEGFFLVTRNGEIVSRAPIRMRQPDGLRTEYVADGRLNGAYSAPADGARHPTLILLHGSEGGSRRSGMEIARRFAGQGFATFAFNYFAWDLADLEGVPNAHVNQPIEMLTTVRDWIAAQPEADVERLGVYGHSKGAEYAEVSAVHLPWIDAVAACVPTDVVWQGYGIGDGRNRSNPYGEPPETYSSFSWQGRALPYVPLEGDWRNHHSNTDFYEANRAKLTELEKADAAIPVEIASARFLWLGGGRDEVWASGDMARRLDRRMREAGEGERSELHIYDRAGHGICGDGTYPTRLWSADSTNPRDPDLDATGRATIDAWNRIVEFFARTLRSPVSASKEGVR